MGLCVKGGSAKKVFVLRVSVKMGLCVRGALCKGSLCKRVPAKKPQGVKLPCLQKSLVWKLLCVNAGNVKGSLHVSAG